jgi:small subunit ribosomal protein S16
MTRTGRLNRPFYRIGVFDSRTRRDGRIIEQLGYYDPLLSTGVEWKVDRERLDFWMGRGAIPSERITAWLRSQKAVFGDLKKRAAAGKARQKSRQAARRRTGRTVEATAKPVMAKKPGGAPAKPKPARAAAKKEKPPADPA